MSRDIPIEFLARVIPYTGLTEQGTGEDLYQQILASRHLSRTDLASHSHLGGFVSLFDTLTTLYVAGITTQDEQTVLGIQLPPGEEQAEGHSWLIPGFYYLDHSLCAARILNPTQLNMVTTISIPPNLNLRWGFVGFLEANDLVWGAGDNPFAFKADGRQQSELVQRAYLATMLAVL